MTSSVPVSSVVLSRYAGALIDLAENEKSVDKIQKDLDDLKAMIEASDDLRHLISSPLISKERQESVVADLSKKAKLQKLTQNFLGVLVQNRRLGALPGIIEVYKSLLSSRAGQVGVRVQTVEKLSAKQEKDLQAKIAKAIGKDVVVETHVSPEILGGMIVTIGSYMIDDSVRRKLERLEATLKGNSNQNTVQNLKEVV